MRRATLIDFRDVTVRFGGVVALDNVCIDVADGEVVCIIGPNGAGKSTILRAISGLVETYGGAISIENQRVDGMPKDVIASLGVAHVPEGRRIFPDLTVEENLRVGAYVRDSSTDVDSDIALMYERFPILGERRRQPGGTLSGGEQQMLAIARALMMRPKVLMLDEPSLGLAPNIVSQIFRILTQIAAEEGVSMLLVEQNAELAFGIAKRGYVLNQGRVEVSGQVEVLREEEAVAKVYLG